MRLQWLGGESQLYPRSVVAGVDGGVRLREQQRHTHALRRELMRDRLQCVQASYLGKHAHRFLSICEIIEPRGIRLANRKNQCLHLLHLHRIRYYITLDARERTSYAYTKKPARVAGWSAVARK